VTRALTAGIATALLLAVFVAACGGASLPQTSDTPTDQPAPTGSLSAPTTTVSPAPPRDELAEPTPATAIDLAHVKPLLTILVAEERGFVAGVSPLATGDFNDDGVDDLLIGVPFADGSDNDREDAGEALVIFGRDGLSGEIDLVAGEPGLRILGALPGDTLGFGVASGDINGDGVDDVIVGAPGSNGAGNQRTDVGETYVVFGSSDMAGTVEIADLEQDFTLVAAEGFARLGVSFAVADVNGDGVDDLVAGAPFAGRDPGTPVGSPRTTVGEVYVVFGSSGLSGTVSVALDQQDLILEGSRELDAFGEAVAASDVNGDAVADIIVGAGGYNGPGGGRIDAGAAFVYFGSTHLAGRMGVKEADRTILGADANDGLGEKLDTGDVDGDGVADIVVVATGGDGPRNGRSNSGTAYVLYGGAGETADLDLAIDEAGSVIHGPSASGRMGTALAVRDLDGDGRDDVVLGAALASGAGRSLNGAIYVSFADALSGAVDLSMVGQLFLYGAMNAASLGAGLAVGDINADGRPELITGANGSLVRTGVGTVIAIALP